MIPNNEKPGNVTRGARALFALIVSLFLISCVSTAPNVSRMIGPERHLYDD
jgi:hypothetical protein